jgi:hypothetical protein
MNYQYTQQLELATMPKLPMQPLLVLCGVVRSLFISYICKRKFFTTRYLRSKAPAWCESSGQAALFNSLPDDQINTVKLISSKVPHEPFSGGSCTPDGGERPTSFLKSQNLLYNLMCHFIMTHNINITVSLCSVIVVFIY